ncbi:MAG: PilN domain-containing protein [Candidatus Methylomirabilales bacterium]
MDITLNLASPQIRKRRRLHHLALGGLCLNLLLGFGNFLLYRSSQAELRIFEERVREYQEALRRTERSLATPTNRLSPAEVDRLGARVTLYNGIIQGANFSWTRLLFELERAIPANVTLVEIQPNFAEGRVILSGDAKTMEDLLRCVRQLKEREAFHQVYLLRQGAKKDQTGNTRLWFTISLRYRGDKA